MIVSPTGRRPVGGALAPAWDHRPGIWGSIGSGVLVFTLGLSGAWQERKGDHVSGKRCSRLDLPGCDPGSGTAARGVNTRETELASRSLLLRDDVRAASPSSPVLCRIVDAPPSCAPARVFLAGLSWKAGSGLAPGPPLKFKVRLFSAGGGPLECRFPYHQKPSQRNDSHATPSPLRSRVLCPCRSSSWARANEPICLQV